VSGIAPGTALEPRSLPRLFDALIGIERRHAWELFVLGMLFHLPVHVFRIAGRFAGVGSELYRANPEFHIGVVWWDAWNSLAMTAGVVAVCQLYESGSTSVQRVLHGMRAGGWKLLGAVVAYDVMCAGFDSVSDGSALGVFLYFAAVALVGWTAPTIPVAVVEGAVPWTAVARAVRLVRSNFWRVAITVWITWSVTNFADSASVSFVFGATGNPTVSGVFDLAVDGFLYPLRGVALALLYFDCRVRSEAYDLEAMLTAVKT
jgi:hypothetical protein